MKKYVIVVVVGLVMALGGALFAQRADNRKEGKGGKGPEENVSGKKHPNLAAAQKLTEEAFKKIEEAQKANEFDMAGHAQKAKELLDQANKELKEAAEAANKGEGKEKEKEKEKGK